MSEGMRGERAVGEWSGLWTAEPTLTFTGTRREVELLVEALLAVAAGAVMWVAFGGARMMITPDAAPAYDLRQLADAVTRMLAVGAGRCEVACRFGGAARVAVEVTSDDGDAATSAPRGGVGAPGGADGGGEEGVAREGATTAGAVALAMREVMVEFGCDAINARRGIARAFGMVLPGELWAAWAVGCFDFVLVRMLRNLGVAEGQSVSADLRAEIREALGAEEPPASEWVRPGAVVWSRLASKDREIDEVRTGPDAAVLLVSRIAGLTCDPIPMGVFLTNYAPPADRAPTAAWERVLAATSVVPLPVTGYYSPIVPERAPTPGEVRAHVETTMASMLGSVAHDERGAAGRAFATAVVEALRSPQGKNHIAEHHIREDARRHPAFATARRAAVMAYVETSGTAGVVPSLLAWLREYEDLRGIGREPSLAAALHARATFGEDLAAVYERARAAHPQPNRIQAPRGDLERRKAIADAFPRPDTSITSYFVAREPE